MTIETYYLGSGPADEDIAQVGSVDYDVRSHAETQAWLAQLRRMLISRGHTTLPTGFRLSVARQPHDFGTYLEVICRFNDSDECSVDLAQLLDGEAPTRWDDDARMELGLLK